MISLEQILGPPTPDLLDPQYAVAMVRHNEMVHYLLSDRDNWVLDWTRWRAEFVAAGHEVPDLETMTAQRSDIAVLDESTAEKFMHSPAVRRLTVAFLRNALLERFAAAESWWDVAFLFPIAFIDFDNRRFAAFYHDGTRLERYIPDGWLGAFEDFATTCPEEILPTAEKFWIVCGRDLLRELNDRGCASASR